MVLHSVTGDAAAVRSYSPSCYSLAAPLIAAATRTATHAATRPARGPSGTHTAAGAGVGFSTGGTAGATIHIGTSTACSCLLYTSRCV